MTYLVERPTLFVVARKNDVIEKYGENIRIRNSNTAELRKKVPAIHVRDIVVCGDINIDSTVIVLAEKYSIPIHFLSNGGKFRASIYFDFSKNVFLRSKQFEMANNIKTKVDLAINFVQAKIYNQNIALRKIRAKGRLKPNLNKIIDLNVLRGVEGASAQKYFSIWKIESVIKNKNFKFQGRFKRPATDEVNALLSFCFSLLHSEIHTQLMIAGLDPFVGFLHEQSFGHSALASDFLETFRGPVEHFVWKTLNRKEFDKSEDFERDVRNGTVQLSTKGFKKFFPKWTKFLRTDELNLGYNLTRLIEIDIRSFVHFLMGDKEEHTPFKWQI